MAFNERFRWLTLLAGVILVLLPVSVNNAQPHVFGVPADSLFHEYSTKYFLDRRIDFAKNMHGRETYLAGITQTVVKEIKLRRKEGSLNPSDITNHTWTNLPPFTPFNTTTFSDRSINIAYPAWEKSQLEEHFRSMIQIDEIRNQLIESASVEQKFRMFQEEYKLGLEAYAQQKWQLSVLWFDSILDAYGYKTVDDILFYRSEALHSLGLLYHAFSGYYRIIEGFQESHYWDDAIIRAFAILDGLNLYPEMVDLYETLESGIAQLETSLQDSIKYRMAQMAFIHGEYDQTIIYITSISPNADHRVPGDILLASARALNGDLETAIRILQETISKNNIHEHIIDDAKVRLANIYSDLGEYIEAIDLLSDVDNNSPCYPTSLLEKAWAYFLLKDYHKTVETTQELLTYFPSDKVAYEAACLDAYSQQTPVAPVKGKDVFQSVMDDAVLSWELENALQERKQILMAFQAVKSLEDAVFISGRRDLFERYLENRSNMIVLMQRLNVMEMWEANQSLQPVFAEQTAIAHIVRDLGELSEPVERSSASSLLHNFLNIQDDATVLHSRLDLLRQMIALRNPPFLQEHDAQFAKSISTWAIQKADEEMEKLETNLASTKELEKQFLSVKDYNARFQLEQDRIKLAEAFAEMDAQRSEFDDINPEIPETHLSWWAEFSFRRSYMSGGLFARYGQRQSRLDDVNSYLNSINQLLIDLESGTSEPEPAETGIDSPNE